MSLTVKDRANIRFKHAATPDETACWIWTGTKDSNGYAIACSKGTVSPAYRYVYENLRGPIPDGKRIKRQCADLACVNPNHYALKATS